MVSVGQEKSGFWSRQFALEATRKQVVFDLVFGAVAPVLCFVFDPIVFKNGFGNIVGTALLSDYQSFAYVVSALEVMMLIT